MISVSESNSFVFDDIDFIDEENRSADLKYLLMEATSQRADSNDGSNVGFDSETDEFGYGDVESDPSLGNRLDDFTMPESKSAPIESYNLVRKLINNLHLRNSEVDSLRFQLQHKELQTQALMSRELQLKSENEGFGLELAKAEQDILLLETKLQDIANFEDRDVSEYQTDHIRGKLLSLANKKLSELGQTFTTCKTNMSNYCVKYENNIAQQSLEIKSLKSELQCVCDQLAQRTVLYSAHERRWAQDYRINQNTAGDMNKDLVELRSKLQLMEQRYEQIDRERIQFILQNKELKELNSNLNAEINEMNDKLVKLEGDVTETTALNIGMQSTINRLRNSDFDAIEKDLTSDLEKMKKDFYFKEDILKRQVEELTARILDESEKKDNLVKHLNELTREIHDKNILLNQMDQSMNQSGNSYNSNNMPNWNSNIKRNMNNENNNESYMFSAHGTSYAHVSDGNSSNNEMGITFQYSNDEISNILFNSEAKDNSHNITNNAYERSIITENSQQQSYDSSRLISPPTDDFAMGISNVIKNSLVSMSSSPVDKSIEQLHESITSNLLTYLKSVSFQHPSSNTVDSITHVVSTVIPNSNDTNSNNNHNNGDNDEQQSLENRITLDFLTGTSSDAIAVETSNNNNYTDDNNNNNNTGTNHTDVAMMEELVNSLKHDVLYLKDREKQLVDALQKQGSKLALVLRKASEMTEYNNNHHDVKHYQQQIDVYKEELNHFEQLVHQSRQVGAQEMAEKYEVTISSQQETIERLKATVKDHEIELLKCNEMIKKLENEKEILLNQVNRQFIFEDHSIQSYITENIQLEQQQQTEQLLDESKVNDEHDINKLTVATKDVSVLVDNNMQITDTVGSDTDNSYIEKVSALDLSTDNDDEGIVNMLMSNNNNNNNNVNNMVEKSNETVGLMSTIDYEQKIEKLQLFAQRLQQKYALKKKSLKSKLREVISQQQQQYETEKQDILQSIQQQYNELVEELKLAKARLESKTCGINVLFDNTGDNTNNNNNNNNNRIREIVLYPEMLSPDMTLQLVKSIANRSYSKEEFVALFELAKSS